MFNPLRQHQQNQHKSNISGGALLRNCTPASVAMNDEDEQNWRRQARDVIHSHVAMRPHCRPLDSSQEAAVIEAVIDLLRQHHEQTIGMEGVEE